MKNFPIHDLHADLLCYLAHDPFRSAYDRLVRCSIPQLVKGHVKFQVLPIFTETGSESCNKGTFQAKIFSELPTQEGIQFRGAIENASSFCLEDEPLEKGFERLEAYQKKMGDILYISLTWNTENRFGGGASTSVGLKEDGQRLLDYMQEKKILVDLSHASDPLAYDVLSYLSIPVIASHSNLRSVTDVPRNLPDELACEIWRRGGMIGLNFIRYFVGSEDPHCFVKQLEHVLKLGGEKQVCFGADFFYEEDVSQAFRKPADVLFFPDYSDATAYPKVIHLWQKQLGLPDDILEGIAHKNLQRFLKKQDGTGYRQDKNRMEKRLKNRNMNN